MDPRILSSNLAVSSQDWYLRITNSGSPIISSTERVDQAQYARDGGEDGVKIEKSSVMTEE